MINLNFGLWWSGHKISYLRYLTFKTLRYFHPDSNIELFVGTKFKKDGHSWGCEKQEFENPEEMGKDYMVELGELGVEVRKVDWFSQYHPNFQSDIFRWWYLNSYGGFYLDTDQIILRSFDDLPLDNDLIFSAYEAKSCGLYAPVGVIGASKDSEVVKFTKDNLLSFLDINSYNSLGPFMFRQVITMDRKWNDKFFNAPSNVFYPVPDSYLIPELYSGKFEIPSDSYSLHWFGGHPKSQEFNRYFTEEFAMESNDTISKWLRGKEII